MFAEDELRRFQAWLDAEGIGAGPLSDVQSLQGGSQNVLIAFSRSGIRSVLRRPPPSKRTESDLVLRREAQILSALARTDVPFPRLIGACNDETVLGGAFHVSEFVDGFSFWDVVPEPWTHDPHAVHRSGLEVVEAFSALARVDYDAVGLSRLAKPDWLRRQPERWRRQLMSYAAVDGFGGDRLKGASDIYEWLVSHFPEEEHPGLVHGDAHLGNVLVRRDGAGVALVDWELCTVGEPRLDLGQLLATWPVPGGPYAGRVSVPGLPTAPEIVEHWARTSGREPADLEWFHVFAAYRLAVLLEGTHARARAGQAPAATGRMLHDRALALLASAYEGSAHVGL